MALDVYELRAEDIADASALWQARGLAPAFEAVHHAAGGLVLIARDAGRLLALAACIQDASRSCVLHVLVADGCEETMRQRITGIALRKLRARGIAKCHVVPGSVSGEASGSSGQDALDQPFFASLRFNIPPTTSDAA